jgi:hypothetical protein
MTALETLLASDILTLGMAADEARRSVSSASIVTYLRVHTLALSDLHTEFVVPEAASELRLYELPPTVDEAISAVTRLKQLAQNRRVAAFSMADLETRCGSGWGARDHLLDQLVRAGLDDVAEMPIDLLANPRESMQALRNAGARPRRITVSAPSGDGKLQILDPVRACRDAMDGSLYFAPLPRRPQPDKPTTGYEDLRMVALARLALSNTLASDRTFIEVDWTLYGPKLAQMALIFGADHLDAVPATSDPALGPRRATVADVERNIRAAGFEAREFSFGTT